MNSTDITREADYEETNDGEIEHQETDHQDTYEEEQHHQTDIVNHKLFIEKTSTTEIPPSKEEPIELEESLHEDDLCTEDPEMIEEVNDLPSTEYEVVDEFEKECAATEEVAPIDEIVDSNDPTTEEQEDDFTIDIDPRYNHLCGKKLLADITIVKETFEKGTIIDAALIQFAIINNAIVKVIMNTDD